MTFRAFARIGLFSTLLGGIPWLEADTQFRARHEEGKNTARAKGQCDIRLRIEGETEVSVRGDLVYLRTISGRDGSDDGSVCTAPLPSRKVEGFHFEAKGRRDSVRLLFEPSRQTDYQAVVRIRDTAEGEGRYQFRLTWDPDSAPDHFGDLARRGGGLTWNNTMHSGGPGQGTSTLTGHPAQRLSSASVDIDHSGRLLVSFRANGGPPVVFHGIVIGSEGSTLRADVVSESQPDLRGTMLLSRDGRGQVFHISLDAAAGPDRLRLDWEHK